MNRSCSVGYNLARVHGVTSHVWRSMGIPAGRRGTSSVVTISAAVAAVVIAVGLVWLVVHVRAGAAERAAAAKLAEMNVFLIRDGAAGPVTNVNLSPVSSPLVQDRLDEVMPLVGRLRHLKDLTCEGAPIEDRHIAHLVRLSNLASLTLMGTNVTNDGVRHLARLGGLESLFLSRTKVTHQCAESLAKLRHLKILNLSGIGTVESLAPLTRLKELKHIVLSECKVADQVLAELGSMKSLSRVTLDGSEVSEAAVARLRQDIPGIAIDQAAIPPPREFSQDSHGEGDAGGASGS